MPESFREIAARAAALAGFDRLEPDACLLNRYEPGARLTLHQDRNERDKRHPIVSVSPGLPAVFRFAVHAAPTRSGACRWSTATWWSGVARRGCTTTAFRRSPRASIHKRVATDST